MTKDIIKSKVKEYIIQTILQGNNIEIGDQTPLISGGIVDSISTLKMVDFLELNFGIEFQPHEVDRENLDTIDLISDFVLSKQ